MSALIALLLLNAALHALIILRFGVKRNEPVALFAVIYVALGLAVWREVPYALWAALVLSVVGLTGLTLTFAKIERDNTLDKAIWVVVVVTIALLGYRLLLA